MTSRASNAIVELAGRQHGVITVQQAEAVGVTARQLRARERAGWLSRMHRGVYVLGGGPLRWRTRWCAAVLACGERSALSHRHAAALWRVRPLEGLSEEIDVTLSGGGRRRRPGVIAHRSQPLDPEERTLREGIAVTTPARTILDLAAALERRPLERMIDEAERLRLCRAPELESALKSHRGRPGAALLAALLEDHAAGSTLTRSELEERFLALCDEQRLSRPLVNVSLLGLTVDFFWPPAVVVEVDGAASHLTRRGFQDDRDRDALLTANGYRVLRFTWRDVTRRAAVVADRVRRALWAASGDGSPPG